MLIGHHSLNSLLRFRILSLELSCKFYKLARDKMYARIFCHKEELSMRELIKSIWKLIIRFSWCYCFLMFKMEQQTSEQERWGHGRQNALFLFCYWLSEIIFMNKNVYTGCSCCFFSSSEWALWCSVEFEIKVSYQLKYQCQNQKQELQR